MACCNSDSRAIFSQNRTSVMRVTSWQGPLPSPGPRKLLWSWAAPRSGPAAGLLF